MIEKKYSRIASSTSTYYHFIVSLCAPLPAFSDDRSDNCWKKDDSDAPGRSPRQIADGTDGRDDDVGVGCHRVSDPSPTTRVATHLDAREVGKLNVRANLHASRESYDAHRPRAGLEGVSRARDRFRHFGGTNQRTCRKRTISSRDRRSARDRVKNRCE